MPYILNNSNGSILTTVPDATVDQTTNLTFVGRNFSGYGQAFEQNFVYLLENFANNTAPSKPVTGQLWFNTSTQQMNIMLKDRTPTVYKGVASLTLGTTSSFTVNGDMFWDGSFLNIWNGSALVPIGPYSGANPAITWSFNPNVHSDYRSQNTEFPAIRAISNGVNFVSFSNATSYYPDSTSMLGSGSSNPFTIVSKGITLPGTDPVTGSSIGSGYYFWGTSAESLITQSANFISTSSTIGNFYIPIGSTNTGVTSLLTTSSFYYNNGVLNATATSAYYADLAERYEADAVYDEGTVLVIGGTKEVTVTSTFADTRVAGVVSKNPAYLMNKDAGTDETHPAIALKGRVPCKVQGYIKKGDLIVTSSTPGYGIAASNVFGGAIIGKALGSQSEGFGVIEILVV